MNRMLLPTLALAFLTACAAPRGAVETSVRYGRVAQVENVTIEGPHHLGLGSIIGAVAGGVIGHRFGGGHGRDVTTVAGALAGGAVGNAVDRPESQPAQHIIVKLDNGVAVGITQSLNSGSFRPGDRVRIDGSGNDARVVPS
jgi:outer membrane lipoprotein SlyB